MYAETYEFLIVSADLRIEQVLREILPLEDSAYHFTTVSGFGEGEELLSRKNLAVLIDGRMGAERMGAMVQKIQEKKNRTKKSWRPFSFYGTTGKSRKQSGFRRRIISG